MRFILVLTSLLLLSAFLGFAESDVFTPGDSALRLAPPRSGPGSLQATRFQDNDTEKDEEEKEEEEGESITAAAFPAHALGDQSLSINAGLFIPLFFQEFSGPYHATNLTLGGVGNLQWNAYLGPHWRLGLEIGGSFCFSPNEHTLLMLPFTFKVAYVITVSRFEFPLYAGFGVNVIRYRDWSHLDLIFKPGFGAYWRYDLNWSFGLNVVWWLDFQYADVHQSPTHARMGNFLEITPSLFYHF